MEAVSEFHRTVANQRSSAESTPMKLDMAPPDGLTPPLIQSRAHGDFGNPSLSHHTQPYMSVAAMRLLGEISA